MLSRTADSLFWMARYVERAENMARLIDTGRRMSAVPDGPTGRRSEWPSILAASGSTEAYAAWARDAGGEPDEARQWDAITFLMLNRDNPSSVAACFEAARANARSARGALTREMWEAVNDAWIDFRRLTASRLENGSLTPLLEQIKATGAQFRGAADAAALRNDGYRFLRLGVAIERFDATARLLDVKSYAARQGDDRSLDQYAWIAVLRAAGVLRAYHAACRADYEPSRIVDFMIGDARCPRALAFSSREAARHLEILCGLYGARTPSADLAAELAETIGAVDGGALATPEGRETLHALVTDAIRRNNALALAIAVDYHFAPPPTAERDTDMETLADLQPRRAEHRVGVSGAAAGAQQVSAFALGRSEASFSAATR